MLLMAFWKSVRRSHYIDVFQSLLNAVCETDSLVTVLICRFGQLQGHSSKWKEVCPRRILRAMVCEIKIREIYCVRLCLIVR